MTNQVVVPGMKKTMVELWTVLTAAAEAGRKVQTVLDEIQPLFMTKGKSAGGNTNRSIATLRDGKGDVVAIRCYYFKKWMPLIGEHAVEFGAKASSATGFNSMCREGVNLWTKQQRDAKLAQEGLLAKIESGELAPEDIKDAREAIDAERNTIEETDLGFDELDAVRDYLVGQGVDFTEVEAEVDEEQGE